MKSFYRGSRESMILTNYTVTHKAVVNAFAGGDGISENPTLMINVVAKNAFTDVCGRETIDSGNHLIVDDTGCSNTFSVSSLGRSAKHKIDSLFFLDLPANDSTGGDFSL